MQNEELAYAILTPYSMRKSRTGRIIARLISRTGLDLVAARMFTPSEDLIHRYSETIVSETEPKHRATQELIRDYVLKNFTGEIFQHIIANQFLRRAMLRFRFADNRFGITVNQVLARSEHARCDQI